MNIIDIRNKSTPVNHNTEFDRLPEETIAYLKSVLPENIFENSTELVKSIHNLVWKKGIPIYLVIEEQMPDEYRNIDGKRIKFIKNHQAIPMMFLLPSRMERFLMEKFFL